MHVLRMFGEFAALGLGLELVDRRFGYHQHATDSDGFQFPASDEVSDGRLSEADAFVDDRIADLAKAFVVGHVVPPVWVWFESASPDACAPPTWSVRLDRTRAVARSRSA
jgi:hypothetical protein